MMLSALWTPSSWEVGATTFYMMMMHDTLSRLCWKNPTLALTVASIIELNSSVESRELFSCLLPSKVMSRCCSSKFWFIISDNICIMMMVWDGLASDVLSWLGVIVLACLGCLLRRRSCCDGERGEFNALALYCVVVRRWESSGVAGSHSNLLLIGLWLSAPSNTTLLGSTAPCKSTDMPWGPFTLRDEDTGTKPICSTNNEIDFQSMFLRTSQNQFENM